MQSAVQQSKGKRGADSGSDKQQEIGDKGLCEPVCSHLAQQNTRVNPLAHGKHKRRQRDLPEADRRRKVRTGQHNVKLKVEPNETGKGYEFINAVTGGTVPKEYIPAVDAGAQGALLTGVLAGYNVVDVKVTLYDGSYHEVDSSDMAFKIAGSQAVKEGLKQGGSVLLEPIMHVVVTVPEEYMGDVIGDLNSRRGLIQGMEAISGAQQINAMVPLSEMFGYATDLRSKSQGRGNYFMEPSHYSEVPKSVGEKIIADRTKRD